MTHGAIWQWRFFTSEVTVYKKEKETVDKGKESWSVDQNPP